MKRQNIRKGLIVLSFLLFPITIYYFSPYLIIEGLSKGIVTGSFIVFILMAITSIILGRSFCGWICPAGGLSEIFFIVSNKRLSNKKINLIKYFIWTIWMISLILVAVNYGRLEKIDFFFQTKYGISVSEPFGYIVYYGVVGLVGILSLTLGKRGFCHSLCWMAPFMTIGVKLGMLFKIPSLRLYSDKENCISCKWCNKNCPMSLEVENMVKTDSLNNNECILCGECVDTCPKKVIRYSFSNKQNKKVIKEVLKN